MDFYLTLGPVQVAWPLLVGIGFVVGVLQGFFGVGGGWLTTPALNILGFPFVYAVGTDLAFTAAASTVGAVRHLRLGHLDPRLALPIGASAILSLEGARRLVLFLESEGLAGTVLRYAYIAFLLGVGGYVLWRELRVEQRQALREAPVGGVSPSTPRLPARLAWLDRGPRLTILNGTQSAPLAALVAAGVVVGALAGFLGTGGGFILVPLLIYVLRVPVASAVAASLLSVAVSTAFGAIGYWSAGRVEITAAGLMFIGAFLGTQLGAIATASAPPGRLQLLLGLMLFAAGTAVAFRQATWFAPSAIVMFSAAVAICGIILALLRPRGILSRS